MFFVLSHFLLFWLIFEISMKLLFQRITEQMTEYQLTSVLEHLCI